MAIAELVTPADPDRFTQLLDASLLVFGVHLLVVGLLLWRTPSRPRVTSALVTLAGLANATDSDLTTVRPAWADASGAATSACAVVGELALIVWLLVRAGRA